MTRAKYILPEFVDCPLCGELCYPGEIRSVKDGVTILKRDRCANCIEDTGTVETMGIDDED
ncbi:hypothetical protein LCGC14_1435380 [marine sediment metagenome]|uniref:Uncharacterized protein n=1 Tax=marine sediment metagenome TaxID=412755 RepID=A0A0F9MP78_9ZZZZ